MRTKRDDAKLVIFSPHATQFAALALQDQLNDMGINTRIQSKIHFLQLQIPMIVFAPQVSRWLPEKFIAYQVEQLSSSRPYDDRLMRSLEYSSYVIDYSPTNSEILHRLVPGRQHEVLPILPRKSVFLSSVGSRAFTERDIDVLFYGAMNDRRNRAISRLRECFNVMVVTNLFGEQIASLIERSKCIVNIHFYEMAALESIRISEALTFGTPVVSEIGDGFQQYPFRESIDFVSNEDWESMCNLVSTVIRDEQNWLRRHRRIMQAVRSHEPEGDTLREALKTIMD